MAKRVFFSFDYQDVADFRANVVRRHWITKPDRQTAGFFDASVWEEARKKGDVALKRLINGALEGTSVTCVLIGSNTYARPWVRYELMQSAYRGNRLLGVHINSIKDKNQTVKALGPDPFEYLGISFTESGMTATLYEVRNAAWKEYTEVGNGASYRTNGVAQKYWGKFFTFSQLFPTYNWVKDDGYNNFASWVD